MKRQLTALALLLATGALAQTPTPAPKLEPPKTQIAATPEPKKATPDPKASPSASPAAVATPAPVATPATTPAPVVVVLREKEPEQNNSSSLLAGWLGLGLLGVGGFFGWRALKSKGLTVTGAFKQLGVELPQEAPPAAAPAGKPAVAPLPPLPSLSDLPSAGAAPAGVAASAPRPAAPPLPTPTGQPKLVGISGPAAGKVIPLLDALTVGREPDNALALPSDSTVSRKHAIFLPSGTGWELADSGSANGTFVNGQRLSTTQPLSHGDEIKIGSSRLRYEA
jgi:FHA domain